MKVSKQYKNRLRLWSLRRRRENVLKGISHSADQTQVTFCRHDVDIGAGAQTERSKCAAVMGRLTRTSAGLCLL